MYHPTGHAGRGPDWTGDALCLCNDWGPGVSHLCVSEQGPAVMTSGCGHGPAPGTALGDLCCPRGSPCPPLSGPSALGPPLCCTLNPCLPLQTAVGTGRGVRSCGTRHTLFLKGVRQVLDVPSQQRSGPWPAGRRRAFFEISVNRWGGVKWRSFGGVAACLPFTVGTSVCEVKLPSLPCQLTFQEFLKLQKQTRFTCP